MAGETSRAGSAAAPALGPTFEGAATATRAKFIRRKSTEAGWGVVRFYREGEETVGLNAAGDEDGGDGLGAGADCTTLCIPAVPAYMSPGDFLGYIGERWYEEISHCRMVMTSQLNRSLVLLKFRRNREAKAFRAEFDGKVFNSVEPQACHVVFVRKITFETATPSSARDASKAHKSGAMYKSLKPMPPPTPNLVELPTCPVCLERMDETNGLMTIPCSHIFHCTCLQSWKGAGCPVCRFTNPSEGVDPSNPLNQPFGGPASNLCNVCDCADDLWICLICGLVGCGRYKGGHAKDHWKETAHCFALELETQHVWDYAGDMWVHRLIRDKGDGKVVELPGRGNHGVSGPAAEEEEMVPRAKLDAISLECSHLIVSQLESQRAYYEEMVNKAVDKASMATGMAEKAIAQLSTAADKFEGIERRVRSLSQDTIPQLERDLERERSKAKKGENLSRSLGQALQVEKRLNEGLMDRIAHLDKDSAAAHKQLEELRRENAELKEANRDLTMFISGQEKLKELESEGKLEEGDVEGGTASVPAKPKSHNRRRKR
ncbi:RING finger protein ETP1 -like protein [Escovopsis weberi]|uniref:RING finger protein ETP1-like protein n=1 Tax=Escovopsis weberi TaxID=150374 RepID=A0A0M9VUI3_ESCWE|nr:RING finger protein ETP1 -like protein [Escovopsis weberi]